MLFDSSFDETEKSGAEYSELQNREFALIEEQLDVLGLGLDQTLAKNQGDSLVKAITNVNVKFVAETEHEAGRKLCTLVETMISFTEHAVFKKLVATNYPIGRYSAKKAELLYSLENEVKELVTYCAPAHYALPCATLRYLVCAVAI